MSLFQLIQHKHVRTLSCHIEKNKSKIIFKILDNAFHLLCHLYQNVINKDHAVKSEYLSLLAGVITLLLIRLRCVEKSVSLHQLMVSGCQQAGVMMKVAR